MFAPGLMVTTLAVAVTRPLVIPALVVAVARLMSVLMMATLTLRVLMIAMASVAIVVMLPVVAMTVISQGAEREQGDQRHDDVMIVVGICRGARRR